MNRFILVLMTFLLFSILIFLGLPHVYALGHYGIPGSTDSCNVCHDFAGGYYNSPGLGNFFSLIFFSSLLKVIS